MIDCNVAKFFIHRLFQITDKKYCVLSVLDLENPYPNRKWAKFPNLFHKSLIILLGISVLLLRGLAIVLLN